MGAPIGLLRRHTDPRPSAARWRLGPAPSDLSYTPAARATYGLMQVATVTKLDSLVARRQSKPNRGPR